MALWLLKAREKSDGDGWVEPWGDGEYDMNYGVVVRATSENHARMLAAYSVKGDEGSDVWIDQKKTSCIKLDAYGPGEVILEDFHAG